MFTYFTAFLKIWVVGLVVSEPVELPIVDFFFVCRFFFCDGSSSVVVEDVHL